MSFTISQNGSNTSLLTHFVYSNSHASGYYMSDRRISLIIIQFLDNFVVNNRVCVRVPGSVPSMLLIVKQSVGDCFIEGDYLEEDAI